MSTQLNNVVPFERPAARVAANDDTAPQERTTPKPSRARRLAGAAAKGGLALVFALVYSVLAVLRPFLSFFLRLFRGGCVLALVPAWLSLQGESNQWLVVATLAGGAILSTLALKGYDALLQIATRDHTHGQ